MLDNLRELNETGATSLPLMQKFTITATGTYMVDAVPGRLTHFASSGTITATVKYLTGPGVYVAYSTPKALTNAAEIDVVNVGAHSELALVVTAVTGTAIVIANPQALQERGR